MTEKVTYAVLRKGVLTTPERPVVRVIQEPTGHCQYVVFVDDAGRIGMAMPSCIE